MHGSYFCRLGGDSHLTKRITSSDGSCSVGLCLFREIGPIMSTNCLRVKCILTSGRMDVLIVGSFNEGVKGFRQC